jgi:hypothetical protein
MIVLCVESSGFGFRQKIAKRKERQVHHLPLPISLHTELLSLGPLQRSNQLREL